MLWNLKHSTPIRTDARGGDFFVCHNFVCHDFEKIHIKQKLMKLGCYFFLWEVSTIKGVCHRKFTTLPLLERAPGTNYPTLPHSEI